MESVKHAHDNDVQREIKETAVEITQGSKFKFQKLKKKWGGQGRPKCPASYDPVLRVLYETIGTVLVSDVKPPCQTMLAISTVSVTPAAVSPPTTMTSL